MVLFRCFLMCFCVSVSHADDDSCSQKASGTYPSALTCAGFYMCGGPGLLLRVGECPCDKIFHTASASCEPQNDEYFVDPFDCIKFHRCTMIGNLVLRTSFACHPGLGFTITKHSPLCEPQDTVPECKKQLT